MSAALAEVVKDVKVIVKMKLEYKFETRGNDDDDDASVSRVIGVTVECRETGQRMLAKEVQ